MMPDMGKPHLHSTQSFLPCGRALLVDDDAKDLKYFTMLLGGLGYAVRAFTNYQEAEGCLEHEHFDFVIVNQGSPAFEAHHLVEAALARNRHTGGGADALPGDELLSRGHAIGRCGLSRKAFGAGTVRASDHNPLPNSSG